MPTITGSANNDHLIGSGGDDTLEGLAGNDLLEGAGGNDNLVGGDGDDVLIGGAGTDILNGGAGSDTISYHGASARVVANLTEDRAESSDGTDLLVGIENVIGSVFDDNITGDLRANRLDGGNGDDVLNGGSNDDVLIGWAGADVLLGGSGTDTADYSTEYRATMIRLDGELSSGGHAEGDDLRSIENVLGGTGRDTIIGSAAANRFEGGQGDDQLEGRGGGDALYGGDGNDAASYRSSDIAVTVDLQFGLISGGHADGDTLFSIESLVGSAHADNLRGDAAANQLCGNDGDDRLEGRVGEDFLLGGQGADYLDGGLGQDSAVYHDSGAGVSVDLDTGLAFGGDAQGDVLVSIENLVGSAHDDVLVGAGGFNWIVGGAGDDFINGAGGGDTLSGGLGADYLLGGEGRDIFIFEVEDAEAGVIDSIGDFETGVDRLLTVGSNDAYIVRQAGGSMVYFRPDGQGGYLNAVQVSGVLQATDFGLDANSGVRVIMVGDAQNDDLVGGVADDVLVGNAGADRMRGGVGYDILTGGAGADVFDYDTVQDSTYARYDVITDFTTGQDLIDLIDLVATGRGNLAIGRLGGSSFLYFAEPGDAAYEGVIQAIGEIQGTDLLGISGLNLTFYGSDAADTFKGANGNDHFLGGAGDDVLHGGGGADNLFGGVGADRFVIGNAAESSLIAFDTIQDFQVGLDKLDLRGAASSVVLSVLGADTFVYFSPDGAGGFNSVVQVRNAILTQADVLVTGESNLSEVAAKGGPLTLPPLIDEMDPLVLPPVPDEAGVTTGTHQPSLDLMDMASDSPIAQFLMDTHANRTDVGDWLA